MEHSSMRDDSERLEDQALAHSAAGLVVFDYAMEKMTIRYLSEGFYRMLGDRKENRSAFAGVKAINSVYPEDRAGILAAVKKAIATSEQLNCRYRILNGRGEYMWIGLRADHEALSPLIERFYGTYYDVDQLVQEKKETAAILENVPAGLSLFALTPNSVVLQYANPHFFSVNHWDRAHWDKNAGNPMALVHPRDRALFHERMEHLRAGRYDEGALTYRALGQDGCYHWVSARIAFAFSDGRYSTFYVSSFDIDARIAAEQEKEKITKMYEAATRDLKLVVWSYDPAAKRIIMMKEGYSAEICHQFGIPEVIENAPASLLPFVNEADRPLFQACYDAILSGKEEAHADFRFRLPKQNEEQFERMSLRRISDAEGEPLGIYGSGQNITLLKIEEEKYEQALSLFQGPEYYASFRLNLSRNICRNGTLGKSKRSNVDLNSLEGSGTVDGYFAAFEKVIDSAEVRADFRARFQRSKIIEGFAKGETSVSIDYPFVYQNGERHWRRGIISLMRNPANGDIEGVAYSTDCDSAKRSEFLLSALTQDHFDYIGLMHPADQSFEFLSKTPAITLGEIGVRFPYEKCLKFIGGVYRDADGAPFPLKSITMERLAKTLNQKGPFSLSFDVLRNGVAKVYQIRYSWFEKPGGDILAVRSDITAAYRKEKALVARMNKAKVEAERANQAKSDFLSQMSHDIRTPLNGIIGLNYLLSEMDLPEEAKDSLQKMDASSKFLLGLINDILDLSKAESGKLELHPEPYPVDEFARYVDAVASPLFRSRYQSFSFKPVQILSDRVPLMDRLRINQIVFNLLSNASKYTPEGGSASYQVDEKPLPGFKMAMHVEVADNGLGMNEECQKRIFKPFYQASGSDRAEMRGSGLGLAITKRLVDAMKGKIGVRSAPGKGSVFTLDFVWDCQSPAVRKKQPRNPADSLDLSRLKGRKVLLCEDNAINQEIAQRILQEKGLEVTLAKDGKDGLQKFEQSPHGYFDYVLMDVRMPRMDGLEATKAIRSLARSDAKAVPILAMTADAFNEDVARCEAAGMNGHLAKPIEPQKLFETLLSFLA